jgi:hypothetical protein
MAFNAWLTSNGLIDAVKRKISIPIAQGVMEPQDILDFATEELLIAQVPSVLEYHEEYFVWQDFIDLEQNKTRYPIPERAIGMKLRDVWFRDTNDTIYEMTRITPEEKDLFQRNSAGSGLVRTYYLQNNWIVLTDSASVSPNGGRLQVEYYLRPNRLVPDERAAYIQSFTKVITVDNTTLTAGDTFTIGSYTFTAVAGSPGSFEFQIGGTSALSAANLSSSIGNEEIILGSSVIGANITLEYELLSTEFQTSNEDAFAISTSQGVKFTDTVPTNITSGSDVDFLQTRPGHCMRGMDVRIPSGGVSTDTITFSEDTVPEDTVVGDYVALSGEGIIPQIPTDLHTGLADRTCARILAAIGDQAGVDSINQKLSETEARQGALLNNRVEGSLPKIVARHSLLRQGKLGSRWRF